MSNAMMSDDTTTGADRQPPRLSDADAAIRFCDELSWTIDELVRVLDEESTLVRATRLNEANALAAKKTALSAQYSRHLDSLKTNSSDLRQLAPDGVDMLRARQTALESALQTNMTVLATARTVSETLIRSLAEQAGERKAGPSVYGADGRSGTAPTAASPIRVNAAL